MILRLLIENDDAGQFLFKDMELKRKYREEVPSGEEKSVVIKRNGWLRRNLSLTGLYYHLSKYVKVYLDLL